MTVFILFVVTDEDTKTQRHMEPFDCVKPDPLSLPEPLKLRCRKIQTLHKEPRDEPSHFR